ncbi:unnamed protein product [Protopolystoma xenopodis]|uniref:Uncharacterized protein n=1 Tax=Protopolystoma xenopodis TaxID=117903 RepID=A0A448WH17_9PLAT|nr:unnamed protein product [Protopolystoma xenopodis]
MLTAEFSGLPGLPMSSLVAATCHNQPGLAGPVAQLLGNSSTPSQPHVIPVEHPHAQPPIVGIASESGDDKSPNFPGPEVVPHDLEGRACTSCGVTNRLSISANGASDNGRSNHTGRSGNPSLKVDSHSGSSLSPSAIPYSLPQTYSVPPHAVASVGQDVQQPGIREAAPVDQSACLTARYDLFYPADSYYLPGEDLTYRRSALFSLETEGKSRLIDYPLPQNPWAKTTSACTPLLAFSESTLHEQTCLNGDNHFAQMEPHRTDWEHSGCPRYSHTNDPQCPFLLTTLPLEGTLNSPKPHINSESHTAEALDADSLMGGDRSYSTPNTTIPVESAKLPKSYSLESGQPDGQLSTSDWLSPSQFHFTFAERGHTGSDLFFPGLPLPTLSCEEEASEFDSYAERKRCGSGAFLGKRSRRLASLESAALYTPMLSEQAPISTGEVLGTRTNLASFKPVDDKDLVRRFIPASESHTFHPNFSHLTTTAGAGSQSALDASTSRGLKSASQWELTDRSGPIESSQRFDLWGGQSLIHAGYPGAIQQTCSTTSESEAQIQVGYTSQSLLHVRELPSHLFTKATGPWIHSDQQLQHQQQHQQHIQLDRQERNSSLFQFPEFSAFSVPSPQSDLFVQASNSLISERSTIQLQRNSLSTPTQTDLVPLSRILTASTSQSDSIAYTSMPISSVPTMSHLSIPSSLASLESKDQQTEVDSSQKSLMLSGKSGDTKEKQRMAAVSAEYYQTFQDPQHPPPASLPHSIVSPNISPELTSSGSHTLKPYSCLSDRQTRDTNGEKITPFGVGEHEYAINDWRLSNAIGRGVRRDDTEPSVGQAAAADPTGRCFLGAGRHSSLTTHKDPANYPLVRRSSLSGQSFYSPLEESSEGEIIRRYGEYSRGFRLIFAQFASRKAHYVEVSTVELIHSLLRF